jgi:hypothetical protein
VIAPCRNFVPAPLSYTYPRQPHQPAYAKPSDGYIISPQLVHDAATAIRET